MKFSTVFHTGTVVTIYKTKARVELDRIPQSECGACSMAAVCGKDKDSSTVDASITPGLALAKGMKVRIESVSGARTRANILLLVLPATAFLGGIIAASLLGTNEAIALAAGTAACLLCFLILFLTRGRRKPLWRVTRISD